MKTLRASKDPLKDIAKVAYPGQPKRNRTYLPGFEMFFEEIPKNIKNEKRFLIATYILNMLGSTFKRVKATMPAGKFRRDILAIEKNGGGKEVILAHWGKGFVSPIHGHGTGLMYENLITGKVLAHLYRLVGDGLVRPISSTVYNAGDIIAAKMIEKEKGIPDNQYFIHNFEVLEPSISLHFLVAHSLDGGGAKFNVEHYEDYNHIGDYKNVTVAEAMAAPIGSVHLVSTKSSKDYRNHFTITTGTNGEHMAITTESEAINRLRKVTDYDLILQLRPDQMEDVREFYGIQLIKGKVILPE